MIAEIIYGDRTIGALFNCFKCLALRKSMQVSMLGTRIHHWAYALAMYWLANCEHFLS